MSKFVKFNANPFSKVSNDCLIRALVLGTKCGYRTLCGMFMKVDPELKESYESGFGMLRGIPLNDFPKFVEEYNMFGIEKIETDAEFNLSYRDLKDHDKYGGLTLRTWMDNLDTTGDVIALCKLKPTDVWSNPDVMLNDTTKYHAIYVRFGHGDATAYDLDDTRNSIVMALYKVSSQIKRNSRFYWETEAKRLKNERIVKMRDEFLKVRNATRDNIGESDQLVGEAIGKRFTDETLRELFHTLNYDSELRTYNDSYWGDICPVSWIRFGSKKMEEDVKKTGANTYMMLSAGHVYEGFGLLDGSGKYLSDKERIERASEMSKKVIDRMNKIFDSSDNEKFRNLHAELMNGNDLHLTITKEDRGDDGDDCYGVPLLIRIGWKS